MSASIVDDQKISLFYTLMHIHVLFLAELCHSIDPITLSILFLSFHVLVLVNSTDIHPHHYIFSILNPIMFQPLFLRTVLELVFYFLEIAFSSLAANRPSSSVELSLQSAPCFYLMYICNHHYSSVE